MFENQRPTTIGQLQWAEHQGTVYTTKRYVSGKKRTHAAPLLHPRDLVVFSACIKAGFDDTGASIGSKTCMGYACQQGFLMGR